MRVGSLFSGIGGLELGLERAGMKVAWQAEYDKQARRVLARHWPNVHRYEDVHDVRLDERRDAKTPDSLGGRCDADAWRRGGQGAQRPVNPTGCSDSGFTPHRPAVDVICGGFPCQDYSVAGKRGGLAGDRGALCWEMHRIVAQYRPAWVVGENVSGLLSSNGGADFRTIIASLVQLGYGVTWATLDSQYFGVAQRRRRLFIVGHSGGVPRPEVLAISEGLRGHPAPSREVRAGATEAVSGSLVLASGQSNAALTEGFSPTLTTLTTLHDGPPIAFDTSQITSALNRSNPKQGDPCHTLLAGAHAPAIAFTSESVHREGTHQDGVHHTLRVQGRAAIAQDHVTPRRLSPIECERLQGFPDGWTEFYDDGSQVADGPRYRMLGNAVTVNVAEWIGRRIMEAG